MHALSFGKTERAADQPLDSRSHVDVLALDLLRVFFANRVLLGLHMTLVGAPAIHVIARDAQRLSQRFQLQKDGVLVSSEHQQFPELSIGRE